MSELLSSRTVLILNDVDDLRFREIYDIEDPRVAIQAFGLAKTFEQAMLPVEGPEGTESMRFSAPEAVKIIQESDDIALVSFAEQSVTKQNETVEVMVQDLLAVINGLVSIPLSSRQEKAIETSLTESFTELEREQNSAWIFWSRETASNTSYLYNITFAIQSQDTGFFLHALPLGLETEVNVDKATVLGFTTFSRANFSTHMNIIQAVQPIEHMIMERALARLLSPLRT